MSSNISGFQGVNTPLQSMTNGKYTLADYTKMNTTFGARITALEKAVAFNPNNIVIGGSLTIQPNSTQAGTLSVASNGTINGNLSVAKTLTVTQNAIVNGTLSVAGAVTYNTLAVNNLNTMEIANSGNISSATFSGDGAGLTSVVAAQVSTSNTGGNTAHYLCMVDSNVTEDHSIHTDGGLHYIPSTNVLTATSFTGSLTGNADSATNCTNLMNGTDGQIPYQSAVSTTSFVPTGAPGQVLTSQGAFAPAWATPGVINDPTKMPLAGGQFTGNVQFTAPACAINYKQNQYAAWFLSSFDTFQLNPSTHDVFSYQGSASAPLAPEIYLTNNGADSSYYQDGMRLITVIKPVNDSLSTGYAINVYPPTGYQFRYFGVDGGLSYTMSTTTFSVTFMLVSAAKNGTAFGWVNLISKV